MNDNAFSAVLASLAQQLEAQTPKDLHPAVASLLHLLAAWTQRQLSEQDVVTSIRSDADLQALLMRLSGREIHAGQSTIAFADNAQLGDFIAHDIVGGHSIAVTINLHPEAPTLRKTRTRVLAQLPHQLRQAARQGRLVLVVGPAFAAAGQAPSVAELAKLLAEKVGLQALDLKQTYAILGVYEQRYGRVELIAQLQRLAALYDKKPSDLHHALAGIKCSAIITTNVDAVLEQAIRYAGRNPVLLAGAGPAGPLSVTDLPILKLHGQLDQPEQLILTTQDCATYALRSAKQLEQLAALTADATLLLLGYPPDHPALSHLLELLRHPSILTDRRYALVLEDNPLHQIDLEAHQILPIQAPPAPSIGERNLLFLHALKQCTKQQTRRAQEQQEAPAPPAAELTSVRELLDAMGYRILDEQTIDDGTYFLCHSKWGAELRQEVILYVAGTPRPGHLHYLSNVIMTQRAAQGILLSTKPLAAEFQAQVSLLPNIKAYTTSQFRDRLIDARSYVEQIVKQYEESEIPVYFVPQRLEADTDPALKPAVAMPAEAFLNAWLAAPERNHLSILGDFGTGKTWLCRSYSYLIAKQYLQDPSSSRIPILIPLRDYARFQNLEQLITDVFVNRLGINLPSGYRTFALLNAAGKFLLIFDGFDEIEQRVSDYRSTVETFWELGRVISPASKVILTCRTAYFRNRTEEAETLVAPGQASASIMTEKQIVTLANKKRMEVVYLQEFNAEDIRLALQKRLPDTWSNIYTRIMALGNLQDLASRPVLLAMLAQTIGLLKDMADLNLSSLYDLYTGDLLKRRWSADNDYIPPDERRFFVQELAWDMYYRQQMVIPFGEIPERVVEHFQLKNDPEKAAFVERDIRTQSYLTRDTAGNYRFAHKSFQEFFVAKKLFTLLTNGDEPTEALITAWGSQPLSIEISDFLLSMNLPEEKLWALVDYTREKDFATVRYSGGNAVTLLRYARAMFAGRNFMKTVLRGAVLTDLDLSRCNFKGADLSESRLWNVVFNGKRFQDKPLREHLKKSSLFAGARLDSVQYSETLIESGDIPRKTRTTELFSYSCFPAETLITMSSGAKMPISEVTVGATVRSYANDQHTFVEGTVIEVFEGESSSVLLINDNLCISPSEFIFLNESWQRAVQIRPGDIIFSEDGPVRVDAIQHIPERTVVYNLQVRPVPNFFASTILVHNMPRHKRRLWM